MYSGNQGLLYMDYIYHLETQPYVMRNNTGGGGAENDHKTSA